MFIVEPRKQLKQIFPIEHNIVKNPNWLEANQLASHKRGRGFERGATEKQIKVVVRAGLEPGTAGLRVQHADHSATPPSGEPIIQSFDCIIVIWENRREKGEDIYA